MATSRVLAASGLTLFSHPGPGMADRSVPPESCASRRYHVAQVTCPTVSHGRGETGDPKYPIACGFASFGPRLWSAGLVMNPASAVVIVMQEPFH